MVIVNVADEISEPVKKCVILCTQALKYLGETRVRRPAVHFVLNKRENLNRDYCETLIECVRKALNDNKLNNEINLHTETVHVLPIAFNSKSLIGTNVQCAASSIVPNVCYQRSKALQVYY